MRLRPARESERLVHVQPRQFGAQLLELVPKEPQHRLIGLLGARGAQRIEGGELAHPLLETRGQEAPPRGVEVIVQPQGDIFDTIRDASQAASLVFLGMRDPALADQLRMDPAVKGVVIIDVANGSPAQQLGFQKGDLVLSVNNASIAKTRDLNRAAGQRNRVWRITIVRGGQQMSVELRG